MIVFPILFIVLGILTALLNWVPAESFKGFAITEAIKGAVTAWPIIFAAIIAQSLKSFALYKVERGVRLMTLEQLISSHSVGAAIKQPFFLRSVNWIAIGLLFLWSLSPLASQALQRMSYLGYVLNNVTVLVPYLDTTGYNSVFSVSMEQIVIGYSMEIQGLYASCLWAPAEIQNSPLDTWNNTKIPLMEELGPKIQGWYPVKAANASQFSSLLGIPMTIPVDPKAGIPYEAEYSDLAMIMQSTYLTISDCTPQVIQTQQDINHTISQSTNMFVSPSGTLIMSLKLLGYSAAAQGDSQLTQLPGILTFSSDTGGKLTTGMTTDGNEITESLYSFTSCKMTQSFVDSQVYCSGDQCRVTAMRPSLNVTQLSSFVGVSGSGPAFIESFVNATGSFWAGAYSLTETYINDPDVNAKGSNSGSMNVSAIPLPDFQQRLALLLNTYWQAGFAPTNQTSGLSATVSAQNGENRESNVKLASAVYTESYYAYVTSWAWLVVLFASSAILLVAGAISAYFDAQTIGPDVLGFASSLTRNNKYMDLPNDNSTMSGPERVRMLGDVRVMMQDVKPGSGVGKIALGTVSEGAERLKVGRLYR